MLCCGGCFWSAKCCHAVKVRSPKAAKDRNIHPNPGRFWFKCSKRFMYCCEIYENMSSIFSHDFIFPNIIRSMPLLLKVLYSSSLLKLTSKQSRTLYKKRPNHTVIFHVQASLSPIACQNVKVMHSRWKRMRTEAQTSRTNRLFSKRELLCLWIWAKVNASSMRGHTNDVHSNAKHSTFLGGA